MAPIGLAVLLGLGLPLVARTLTDLVSSVVRLPGALDHLWAATFYQNAALLVLSLVVLRFFRRGLHSDFGLRLPEGVSYARAALGWGLLFAMLLAGIEWSSMAAMHQFPQEQYPLNRTNVSGWLAFAGLFSGPSQEVLYRGLLVTYLMARLPGRVGFRRLEMSVGGVVAAAITALPQLTALFSSPLYLALALLLTVFAMGVLFAYWFEKSKSLLAPVIGHNVAEGMRYAFIFWLVALTE